MKQKQLWPALLFILAIAIVYWTKLHHQLTLDKVRSEYQSLQLFVECHPFISPLLFMSIYMVSVALIIPDSTLLTLLAGTLFPVPLALVYCLVAETSGAFLIFLAIRRVGHSMESHEVRFLHKLRLSFQKNSASYLLFLRFSHLLPFWLTNIAAAYFGVSKRIFLWTTALGLLPLTLLLIFAGQHFKKTLELGIPFSLSSFFTPGIKLLLLLFGLLCLIPLFYKKWKN